MAVFVLVAKEGTGYVPPACTTPVFADVPASNPFCRWIEELARRAVVSGCGGGNYCPTSAVTREQMAVFVLRTLDPAFTPPDCTTPMYGDVPASSPFCRWIEELTRRAVVTGCGGDNYCPTAAGHPRADGRLPERDVRLDAVRPLIETAAPSLSRFLPRWRVGRWRGPKSPEWGLMTKIAFGVAVAILVSAGAVSAQTPAGGEFRVNTYTTGSQFRFGPAMGPDGDFVIVWSGGGVQDGSGYGAFGQRFSASGAMRGSEFLINTYTTGRQINPSAAVGGSGNFVVVWEGVADGSVYSIQGQRFDVTGSAVGGEFLVNTFTTGRQYIPRIGQAADGRFVVAWTSEIIDGDRSGIVARRFDTSGIPMGADFLVNTYTTGVQGFFDVAVEANGNFVAVWQDDATNNRDGSGSGIFGQRFDAAGNRLSSEFQVNSYTTGVQQYPSVSISPAGGFVVAWSNEFGDGDGFGTFARRFDGSGNAVGSDFVANTYTTGDQAGGPGVAQVAHDARGNFVVTWRGYLQSGSGWDSFAQRFSASGAPRGDEFRVNAYTTNSQLSSAVASDSLGNFVVAWQSGHDGSGYGVFAQRFGGLGPAALTVDSLGNQVLEPGEAVDVRPSWSNRNGASQTFGGALLSFTGPPGAVYTLTDPAANYGALANGATGPCTDCYGVAVSNPPTRPAMHWDAAAVEGIVPDAHGQQKQWLLHVGRSFTDVPVASGFYRFIETLLHHGVTSGCSPTQYCPATATTRDQMAVFVLVAKEGTGYAPPACTTPIFGDVPASNPFCRWIEELARRGVAGGCGGGNYCPSTPVTREQMAVFVLRTLEPALTPPDCTAPIYNDVPASNGFCRWIEELTRRGVVSGCGGGNYCPTASVTREQMGVFLSVTFGLALYGP